ncbi:PREDICTED: transcription factor GTE12 [Theobroma cacao]|uniref:Transcription factor GTE12 n=2 Tax=Theobroma cacao TaxID=3641 RepID=A0AB32UTI1_THECC|nr:PREDICTED: transcription factor GTE12 [Theobroma cacao]
MKFPSQSFEFGQQPSSSFDGKRTSSRSAGILKRTSAAYKRGPEGVIVDSRTEKRRKMDRSMAQQCPAHVDESRRSCPKSQLSRCYSFPKKSRPSEEKFFKVPLNARATEVERPKPAQKCVSRLARKNFQKGASSGGRAHRSINAKPPLSPGACRCSSCGSIKCQCSLPSDSNHASSSDVTSERSLGGDLRVCRTYASKLDCQAKRTMTSPMSESDPDSDGAVSSLYDENVCLISQLTTPATDAASGEGLLTPSFDVQMSSKKAFRAAMLKSRYADTILKAKHILDHGEKADPVKMQQQKGKLERRQREEKAKIEAQIRAAEAAAKMKAEVELKKQREREREAARNALQQMEKTAGIELNVEIEKEFEMLIGFPIYNNWHGSKNGSGKVTGAYGGTL